MVQQEDTSGGLLKVTAITKAGESEIFINKAQVLGVGFNETLKQAYILAATGVSLPVKEELEYLKKSLEPKSKIIL